MKGSGLPLNGRKDRDEESLVLFKDLHKREKDQHASLLLPISDEFEPNGGNYALYRLASGKKGSGYEFLGENDKNDYDWLKTPPATPLFPSLEMEANATQLIVQREIPIIQPLSRFAGNIEASKGSTATEKSSNSRPKILHQRPSISENNKNPKVNPNMDLNKRTYMIANTAKLHNKKEAQTIISAKNIAIPDANAKSTTRGVSPSIRSTIPARILGFSSDTPPNLRTDRATSATRGRPVPSSIHQKSESTQRTRSVTRGGKESERIFTSQKGKIQIGNNNGTQIFGSRIVEKVLNARKLGTEEREAKSKAQSATGSNNGSSTGGFGRIVSKSSRDTTLKHIV